MAFRVTISDEVSALIDRLQQTAQRRGEEARFVAAFRELMTALHDNPRGIGEARNEFLNPPATLMNAAVAPVAVRYTVYDGPQYVWLLDVQYMGYDEE